MSQAELVVVERRQNTETLWVTPDQIHEQVALVERVGDEELLSDLRRLAEVSDAITAARRKRAGFDASLNRITKQHNRIRKNLDALGRDTDKERDLRERYVEVLDEDEARLSELQSDRQAADDEVQANKRRFRDEASGLFGERASK